MTADEISAFVRELPGTATVVAGEDNGAPEVAWGDSFFYYDPDGGERKLPFATIVNNDYGDFDAASKLHRPHVFRLNVEVGRALFEELVGYAPAAHGERGMGIDYAERDRLLPHPVYAPQGWVCVVNPGERTEAQGRELLTHAHKRARRRYKPAASA